MSEPAGPGGPPDGEGTRPLLPGEAGTLGRSLAAMDPWLQLGSTVSALTDYLERDDPALLRQALLQGGELAGVIAVRAPWLRGPFIELLAVLPSFQRRGVGRQAVAWLVSRALPAKNLWASVSDFNLPARAFWRHHGFEEVAPLPDLVRQGATEILLRRRLGSQLEP